MEKEIRQYNNAQLIPYFVEMINQGHTVTFKLKGFSMRPFLEDGRDKAILGKHTTVRCGDAVLAEISPKTCTLADIRGIALAFYRKGRSTPDYTSGRKWRIYSAIWTRLLPIRRYLLYIYRKVNRLER